MNPLTLIKQRAPAFILILTSLFYWQSTCLLFNPIAIGIILILIFQIVFHNKILGVFISVSFIVLNTYLLLALASELHEFPVFDKDAKRLLFIGLFIISLNIAASIALFYQLIIKSQTTKLTEA